MEDDERPRQTSSSEGASGGTAGEGDSHDTRQGCSDAGAGGGPKEPRRGSVFPALGRAAPARGPSYRIVLALLWVTVQVTLIATASRRSDGAFGFRMFNESSTIELALFRETHRDGGASARIRVEGGVWTARGSDGRTHRSTWYDRVPTPYWIFDQPMHASYGAAAQLTRLQGALDDVTAHLSQADDVETRRLVLDVTVRRNGREPVLHRLASRERVLSPPPAQATGEP